MLDMKNQQITLTHLNIRQSIAILLAKLILTDIIMAVIIIGFYFMLVKGEAIIPFASSNTNLFLIVFTFAGFIKIALSVYIVLEWLNEYYEITPEYVIHKQGIIFRKTEKYGIDKIRRISVQDTFLGELLNYATVTFYDLRLNKALDMYLIHNPDRYAKILRMLKPELEIKTDRIRLPLMPKREEINENEYDKRVPVFDKNMI